MEKKKKTNVYSDLPKVLCVEKSYVLKLACPFVQHTV